eukprot:Rhum_TRINITY_DN11855_c1_g1::Rhum_TRINITY_DN11855_c1_g1_i2::g.47552::m.47552/K07836/RAP1B; Ras-related protein Rap-1B
MTNDYRLVVFGAGGVGKSAISVKFVQDTFVSTYDPSIYDVYKKQEYVDGEATMLEIVDTAGQEQYESMRAQYYKEGQGFIAVYSVADRTSFQEVEKLRNDVLGERNCDRAPMVLVGNKCDLHERKVSTAEGQALAANWFEDGKGPVPFYETSAKEGTNITETFHQVVREIQRERQGLTGQPAAPDAAAAAPAQAVPVTAPAAPEAVPPPVDTTPAPAAPAPAAAVEATPPPAAVPATTASSPPPPVPTKTPQKPKGKKDKKKKKKCSLM